MLLDFLEDWWRFRTYLLSQPEGATVGIKHHPCYCPVAEWVKQETGQMHEIYLRTYNLYHEDIDDYDHEDDLYLPLWIVLFSPLVDGGADHYNLPITREKALAALDAVEHAVAQRLLPSAALCIDEQQSLC